jgi:hypothetical protein
VTGRARPTGEGAPAEWPAAGLFAALVLLVGLVARLRAVGLSAREMFRGFPIEDGYLMLTVARNMALGRGMSTAEGTLPTNGVQPLAAFLQAACFWLMDGEREAGLRLILLVWTAIAAAGAVLVYLLGRRLLGEAPQAHAASSLAAAIWFTSPVVLFHTMNMLETGLYATAVAGVALAFARGHAGGEEPWSAPRCLALGALLGAAFWARNDAVFLMAAVGVAHLRSARGRLARRRAGEVLLMAATAAAVALPWLLHNLRAFGGVVPVSGQAYLRTGDVSVAARAATVALFEHATLLASFEFTGLHQRTWFLAVAALVLLAGGAVCVRALRRATGLRRTMLVLATVYALGLVVFYVFFFNAPHFLRRYLMPLSPLLALAWGAGAAALWRRAAASRRALVAVPLVLLPLLAHFVVRDGLLTRGPWRRDVFFRGVDWVESHLPPATWIGAFQSGTLGFFHDRTINLDGKVNAEALAAIRQHRLGAYVADSPIAFVIDWVSIVEPWSRDASVARRFEWVVRDRAGNFAVIRRRGAPPAPPGKD